MRRTLFCCMLCCGTFTAMGCGTKVTPGASEAINAKADAHRQIGEEMRQKYKGGPGKAHGAK